MLNLQLNICIDSSRGSSNSSSCYTLSSCTVSMWVGIGTTRLPSETSLTEIIWFRLGSSWIKVDDIKSRGQEKHVKVSSKLNSLLYHGNTFKQAIFLWVLSSLFCFSGKVTSKNLPLVSCFVKSNFCWESAEIRLPYHLGSIYAKWLALIILFRLFILLLNFKSWKYKSRSSLRDKVANN